MDTEVKTKWLDALRSGEYHQGAHYLRSRGGAEDNFCCLGVLCELAVAEGVIESPLMDEEMIYQYGPGAERSYLPKEVQAWAGLPDMHGALLSSGDEPWCSLTEMNDQEIPFEEIANVIEVRF